MASVQHTRFASLGDVGSASCRHSLLLICHFLSHRIFIFHSFFQHRITEGYSLPSLDDGRSFCIFVCRLGVCLSAD